jgi:tRNA threonylcarbamoyladenosine biosynthesis protein TsaB
MRLLAIDTSTEACSAALLLGEESRLRFEMTERSHAELILPMIDALLAEAGLALGELDGLAFGRGPGAFTGLRIAAGVTQGLALGSGLPVVGISSLAAVAEQVPADAGEQILVCNDARMKEIYWGVYRPAADRGIDCLGEERVSAPAALEFDPAKVRHVAGNAIDRYDGLRRRLEAASLRIHDSFYPRADAVARLARLEFRAGRGGGPADALPVYVRDSVARPPSSRVTGM